MTTPPGLWRDWERWAISLIETHLKGDTVMHGVMLADLKAKQGDDDLKRMVIFLMALCSTGLEELAGRDAALEWLARERQGSFDADAADAAREE